MLTAEKAVEERDCTQIPVAKKERTDHKCQWQIKKNQTTNAGGKTEKNGCPNQPSKQLTTNERNKTAKTTSKPQTVAYLQALHKVEKTNKHKTPPNHNSLIDNCLQQRSGRLQSEEH